VPSYNIKVDQDPVRQFSLIVIFLLLFTYLLQVRFQVLNSFFPPSSASKPIQIQFRPGPRVLSQLMIRWWLTVLGLLGPELASVRLPIRLLLRRNPERKCVTGHPKSRLMSWLLTHLLLQLLRKVPGGCTISADPTGRLTWNLPLCRFGFFTTTVIQDHVGYLSRLLCEGS
jgi:hypothetical protein